MARVKVGAYFVLLGDVHDRPIRSDGGQPHTAVHGPSSDERGCIQLWATTQVVLAQYKVFLINLMNLAAGSFLLWVAVGFRPKISIKSFCLFSVHLMCFK